METLTQPLNKEAGDRIAHLDGRQGARGSCGLTGHRTESGALGCRDGGTFAYARGARFMDRELRDAGQRTSAWKRRMPRVEPARSRARPTGALVAVKAVKPAYPLSYNGAGEGLAPAPPSNPPLFALPWRSRMGALPPSPRAGAA